MISSTPAAASSGRRRASSPLRPADSTIRSTTWREAGSRPASTAAARIASIGPARSSGAKRGQRLLGEPAVAHPSGAAESDARVAADQEAEFHAPGDGRQSTPAAARTAPTATASGAPVQQAAGDRDPLLEPPAATLEWDVEGGELLLEPARADAEAQPAAARDVDRRGLLREHDGLPQRQHEHGSPDRCATRSPAAISASAIRASKYGVSVGQVARPSSAKGYRDSIACGSTMWSLTQSDSNPAASSSAAIAPMPSRAGSGPLFGTLAPILIVIASPVPVAVIESSREPGPVECAAGRPLDSITPPFCASSVQPSGIRTRAALPAAPR